jgi:hypothetical protein
MCRFTTLNRRSRRAASEESNQLQAQTQTLLLVLRDLLLSVRLRIVFGTIRCLNPQAIKEFLYALASQ